MPRFAGADRATLRRRSAGALALAVFDLLFALFLRIAIRSADPGESCGTRRPHGEAPAARKPRARIPSASSRAGPANACSRAASRARRSPHVVAGTRGWRATAHSPCATTLSVLGRMHAGGRRLVRVRQLGERAVAHRAHRVGVLVLQLRIGAFRTASPTRSCWRQHSMAAR